MGALQEGSVSPNNKDALSAEMAADTEVRGAADPETKRRVDAQEGRKEGTRQRMWASERPVHGELT